MVVPIKWFKENICRSSGQSAILFFVLIQSRRRCTEEERKAHKSFKKLFMSSWFSNKSNNIKVNRKSEPGQSSSSAWQPCDSYKFLNLKTSPKDIGKETEFNKISEGTSGIRDLIKKKENLVENTKKEILSKPSCSRNEEFNIDTPVVTIENVNVTYPRKSPCKKVENINIVLAPPIEKEPLKLPEEFLEKTDPLKTIEYFPKKQPGFHQDDNQKACCSKVISPNIVTLNNDPPIVSMPPKRKTFKPRILTMSNGTKTTVFSSTLKNEEYSLCGSKQSLTTSVHFPNNYIDYQKQKLKDLRIKEKKLLAMKELISKKQELLYRLKEMRKSAIRSPKKDLKNFAENSSSEESDTNDSSSNLLNSTKKSIQLEKIVQNKTRHISRGLVRDLVRKFDSDETTSTPKETYKKEFRSEQTFVKMAAHAMENGDRKEARQILNERGTSTDEEAKIEYCSNWINTGMSRFPKTKRNFNYNNVVTKLPINYQTSTDEETKIEYSSSYMNVGMSHFVENNRNYNGNDVVTKLPENLQESMDEKSKFEYCRHWINTGMSCPLKNDRSSVVTKFDVVTKFPVNLNVGMSRPLRNNRKCNCNNAVTQLPTNSPMHSPNDKIFSVPDSVYPKNLERRVKRAPPNVVCPSLFEKTYGKYCYSSAKLCPINEPYITDSGYRELNNPALRYL
ncbi:hypothetical protein V1478_013646 [Vespula squamosa]|uniref:Uncharacterized protein n=1 Tax=Vespula squamosa TaxID=30214 RepID=A0ABD2A8B0_VESSQ